MTMSYEGKGANDPGSDSIHAARDTPHARSESLYEAALNHHGIPDGDRKIPTAKTLRDAPHAHKQGLQCPATRVMHRGPFASAGGSIVIVVFAIVIRWMTAIQ